MLNGSVQYKYWCSSLSQYVVNILSLSYHSHIKAPIYSNKLLRPELLIMSQKSALITGCSAGGIGDALAQAFQRRGLRVFATARTLSKIQHLEAKGIEILALDVTDPNSLKVAVEHVREATGGTLDVLINNSGVGKSSSSFSTTCFSRTSTTEY
jgi:enoyl-[acyl-carrier-protein] reductase (NADH)